jgi:hypothetical protein
LILLAFLICMETIKPFSQNRILLPVFFQFDNRSERSGSGEEAQRGIPNK